MPLACVPARLSWPTALSLLLIAVSGLSPSQAAEPSLPAADAALPCGPESASPRADWGGPGWMGASDQRFILLMIPHHDGAIAMADLAISRARHPELRALAQRIARSQRKENEQMRAWYRQWYGSEVPKRTTAAGQGNRWGMDHGHGMGLAMGLPEMDTSLAALRTASDFDRAFLEQMIPHHRMGVMMALHALRGTDHRELRTLQEAMVRIQSQEIRLMAAWYRRWFPG